MGKAIACHRKESKLRLRTETNLGLWVSVWEECCAWPQIFDTADSCRSLHQPKQGHLWWAIPESMKSSAIPLLFHPLIKSVGSLVSVLIAVKSPGTWTCLGFSLGGSNQPGTIYKSVKETTEIFPVPFLSPSFSVSWLLFHHSPSSCWFSGKAVPGQCSLQFSVSSFQCCQNLKWSLRRQIRFMH